MMLLLKYYAPALKKNVTLRVLRVTVRDLIEMHSHAHLMLNCQYKSYWYLGSRLCAGQERQKKVRLEYIISCLG